jgi:hypothetical protein
MSWIKRNLIFVITALVGVLLAGWAGYQLTNSMAEDKAAKDDFDSVMNDTTAMRNKNPYPTPENIEAARGEAAQIRGLLGDFNKVFAPFPTVPPMDEKTFAETIGKRIAELQMMASTMAIKTPDHYAFSFSGLTGQLAFPSNCIPVWLEQLGQIKSICDIVLHAHINEFEGIQRVPVYPGDQGGTDFLPTTWVTNQLGVVSPYQVSFVGFSRGLAQILEGFLNSTNCFVIKSVIVSSSKNPTQANGPGMGLSPLQQLVSGAPTPAAPPFAGGARAGAAPVSVVREKPLYVTLVIDAIKLKPVAAAR